MAKRYDVVETSKMAMENIKSLIEVEKNAGAPLENGRIITVDGNGKFVYADASTTGKVYLHASVEKMADTTLGLTEFRIEDGEKCRALGMLGEDIFCTTAFDGVAKVGDIVIIGADGVLTKTTLATTGKPFVAIVEKVRTLGYDFIPAISVRVINA